MDQGNDRHSRHLPGKAERHSKMEPMLNDERRTVEEKACKTCGVQKPLIEFHADRKGFKSSCKLCTAAQRRANYAEAKKAGMLNSEADRQKRRMANRKSYELNRSVVLERSRAAYLKNKEAVKARAIKWQKANPEYRAAAMAKRRAKASDGESHTKDDIKELIAVQKGKCAICRCDFGSRFHVDHIVPLKLGGGNQRSNIQILCPPCNARKGAKHPVVFMQEMGYLI